MLNINDLPNEILARIFTLADKESSMLKVPFVSMHWFQIVKYTLKFTNMDLLPLEKIIRSSEDLAFLARVHPHIHTFTMSHHLCTNDVLALTKWQEDKPRIPSWEVAEKYFGPLDKKNPRIKKFFKDEFLDPSCQRWDLKEFSCKRWAHDSIASHKLFDALGNFKNLETLSLSHVPGLSEDIFSTLEACRKLKHVSFRDQQSIGPDVISMFVICAGETLESIDVSRIHLAENNGDEVIEWPLLDSGLYDLANSKNPECKVHTLELACNMVTNAGVESIAKLLHLRRVDLTCPKDSHRNWISDIGLRHLSTSSTLNEVELRNNNLITDDGVRHLATGLGAQLKKLSIRGCRKLCDLSICYLANSCPNLEMLNFLSASDNSGYTDLSLYVLLHFETPVMHTMGMKRSLKSHVELYPQLVGCETSPKKETWTVLWDGELVTDRVLDHYGKYFLKSKKPKVLYIPLCSVTADCLINFASKFSDLEEINISNAKTKDTYTPEKLEELRKVAPRASIIF